MAPRSRIVFNAIHRSAPAALLLLTGLAGCQEPSRGMLIARGNEAHVRGDFPEALANYDRAADRRPGDAELRYRQGRTYLAMGEPERAREVLTIANDIDPENPLYRDGLLDALVAIGDQDALFATLDRLRGEASTPGDYLAVGRSSQRIGLPDEAFQAYVVAAKIADRDDPSPYRALAALFREIGDEDREIEALRALDYLSPNEPLTEQRVRELGHVPGPTFRRPPNPDRLLVDAPSRAG